MQIIIIIIITVDNFILDNISDNDTSLNIEGMDTWRPNSSSPEYLELPPNLPHNLEDKIKSLKQVSSYTGAPPIPRLPKTC